MDYITLSNGIKAPVLGIGTFMISPADTVSSVYSAIKLADKYRKSNAQIVLRWAT